MVGRFVEGEKKKVESDALRLSKGGKQKVAKGQ